MKIAFFPEDGTDHASSRVRAIQVADVLAQRGHDVSILPGATYPKFSRKDPALTLRRLAQRRRELKQAMDADVWFFHRGGRQYGLGALVSRMARKTHAKIVYDIDDAVYLSHPRGSHALMRCADLVLGGNDLLVDYARQRGARGEFFPTGLVVDDYARHRPKGGPRNEVPVIGWIGNRSNVPYLAQAASGLSDAARKHDFILRIICDFRQPLDIPVDPGITVERVQWTPETAARDVAQLDIGIMPLPDTPWERGKCGFKVLEYFAAGACGVASEVGDGGRLMAGGQRGYPIRADNGNWGPQLTAALDDPKETARRAAAGHAYVRETHDLERVATRLEDRLAHLVAGNGHQRSSEG